MVDYKPAIVLVSLGVNDGSSPNTSSYHVLVQMLHGMGARVMWIEPPAGVAGIDLVRATIASLGIPVVPAMPLALRPDGAHPTSYALWALSVANAVNAELARA
jgi:hypothetical protein